LISHDQLHRFGPFSTQWFKDNGGGRGVMLFFALSGLLICSRMLQEEQVRGAIDLKGFYIRRFCRIQPAALLYLGVIFVLMSLGVLVSHFNDLLSSLFFLRNYVHPHPVEESWYTAHFWSLSIEEHFYLFLPGFLVLIRRFRMAILVAMAIGLEICRARFVGSAIASFQTDLEAATIVLSAAVAVFLTQPGAHAWCLRWLQPWVAFTITGCIWVGIELHHGRFDHAALVCTFPLLVVSTMLHPRSLPGRMLEFAPLKFIGLVSYSLYLWQQMFLITSFNVPASKWGVLVALQTTWLRYFALFGIAIASYYLLERPLMRLGHRLAKPATPGRDDLEPPDGASTVSSPRDASHAAH
jgi:peptidoglycan/LPS O-acetylase OafA/YrhL